MKPSFLQRRLASTLWAAALLAAAPLLARGPYEEGAGIDITGTVTDAQGRPAAGVLVVFEAAREEWSLRDFDLRERGWKRVDAETRQATTDERGRFSIEWPWHDYYNRFVLVAGRLVPEAGGGQRFQELARVDLDRRIRQGSPVVTMLAIEGAAPAPPPARAEASSAPAAVAPAASVVVADPGPAPVLDSPAARSEDERRVVAEWGEPERVSTFEGGGSREVTWWYFQLGKAYRFEDGRLVQVAPFTPVEPF